MKRTYLAHLIANAKPRGGDGGGGGGDDKTWIDFMSVENQAALKDKEFIDLDAMAKSYIDMQAYQGASLRIPTSEAGDDQWKEFSTKLSDKVPGIVQIPADMNSESISEIFKKLGTPEEASAYEYDEVENSALPTEFSAWAHKAGLTKGQARAFAKELLTAQNTEFTSGTEDFTQRMAVLNTEWGQAKDQKVATALNLAEKTGAPPEMISALKEGKVGADTLRWLDNVNKQFGGERSEFNVQPGGGGHVTPAELEMQINDIMAKPEYWTPTSQGTALQNQVLSLQMKINQA